MKQFVLHKVLKKVERKEVEAESFDDAALLLYGFMAEKHNDCYVVDKDACRVEFTGDLDFNISDEDIVNISEEDIDKS